MNVTHVPLFSRCKGQVYLLGFPNPHCPQESPSCFLFKFWKYNTMIIKYLEKVNIKLSCLQGCQLHHLFSVTFRSPETDVCVRGRKDVKTEMTFIEKVKYESIKTLHLICPFKLVPLIIINLLHYISLLNYMCYKGIIALKDAYCYPSSLQSGGEFSLVIKTRCAHLGGVDRHRHVDEFKKSF